MGDRSGVTTGRNLTRVGNVCHGCHARIEIGEPKGSDSWPARLSLTKDQVDLLLLAAVEYEEMSEEAQHISNACEFVDWLAPDVIPGLSTETQRERRQEIAHREKVERERLRREVA